MKKAFYVALQEELQSNGHEPSALYVRPMAAAKAVVEHKMRLFSSAGKADCIKFNAGGNGRAAVKPVLTGSQLSDQQAALVGTPCR